MAMSHPHATLKYMDEQLIERFTRRDCEHLAVALSRLTGWPIVVVSDGQTEEFIGWIHAGVMTPVGTVLDVEGEHDPDDWFDHYAAYLDIDHRHDPDWDGTDAEVAIVDRLERIGVPSDFQPDDVTTETAERLLRKYHRANIGKPYQNGCSSNSGDTACHA